MLWKRTINGIDSAATVLLDTDKTAIVRSTTEAQGKVHRRKADRRDQGSLGDETGGLFESTMVGARRVGVRF